MELTADGVVLDPELHDGFLRGITVSPSKTLTVACSTLSGENVELVLEDVVRLRADNFREGNIIFEVRLLRGSACSPELVRKVFNYSDEEAARLLPRDMRTIANESWNLIAIDSSYGCELVAIARGSVSIQTEIGST